MFAFSIKIVVCFLKKSHSYHFYPSNCYYLFDRVSGSKDNQNLCLLLILVLLVILEFTRVPSGGGGGPFGSGPLLVGVDEVVPPPVLPAPPPVMPDPTQVKQAPTKV